MYAHERSLVQDLALKPFALIGVNSDDDLETLRAVVKEKDLTWPSFFDGGSTSGPIARAWEVRGWPTIFVIDADGVIRARDLRGEELEAKVHELLAELDQAAPRACTKELPVATRAD